ncbi:MAG: hypothetical protein ACYDHN_03435 [Solirubrobacteraceae bacterium]
MHASHPAHRKATLWLAAIVGCLALLLATPALSHAEESNPNNYNCLGSIAAGTPEEGSEEQQVKYSFYCNGPITGYQIQAQIPLTGIQSPPLVTSIPAGTALSDTFSCSGEVPGIALNCVGAAKGSYETISAQFAIGTKLCAEPRVDPLLTVTYAYIEKGAVTQAISGPFDLGRPKGCPADAYSGSTRLEPKAPVVTHKKKSTKKKSSKKAAAKKSAHKK